MSYQRYEIIGNLTDDPEMKYVGEGVPKTTFSVACNERRGEKEEVLYMTVECWDKLAERTAEYLRKGRKVFVEGKLKEDRWEDADGTKRRKTYMRAFTVTFLDKPEGEGNAARSAPRAAPSRNADDGGDYPF